MWRPPRSVLAYRDRHTAIAIYLLMAHAIPSYRLNEQFDRLIFA
jgi:hypothetical protein